MSKFRKVVSLSAVAILGVTNLLTPLSYANAATSYDLLNDADFKQRVLNFMMPNHDVYLYAVTEANKYYVNYKWNTETSWTMPRKQFTYDTTWTLDANKFAKTWYTFTGWNTNAWGAGTDYSDQAEVFNWTAVDSGEIDIYAQWMANKYNIFYNLNPGTGTSTPVHTGSHPTEATYNNPFTVTNPSRTWYTFTGWNISNMDSEKHTIWTETSYATGATGIMVTSFNNLLATSGTVNFLAIWTRNLHTPYTVEHYLENLAGWYPASPRETDNLSGVTDTTVTPPTHSYTWFTPNSVNTPTSGNIDPDGNKVFRYEYTRDSYNLTLTAGRWIKSVKGTGTVNTTGWSANSGQNVVISFKYDEPVALSFVLKDWYQNGTWSGYKDTVSSFNMPEFSTWKTAYATPIEYTIKYNYKSGNVATPNPTTYTVESEDLPVFNPNRVHSDFVWWTWWVIGGAQLTWVTKSIAIYQWSTWNRIYTAVWRCHDWYTVSLDWNSCVANEDTQYIVRHIRQDLDWNYLITSGTTDTEYKTGTTDTPTNATAKTYPWFQVYLPIKQWNISWDVVTVVDITYTRLSYNWTIAAPEWVEARSITATAAGDHPTGTDWTYKFEDTVRITATLETGYTFNGWTVKDAGGNDVTVTNPTSLTNATFEMPASAVTITPNVTKVGYTITYNLNSGSVTTANPTGYNVETPTFPLNNPERDHSTFVWWSWTAISWTSLSVTIAKWSVWNRSYEAIWKCHTWYHAVWNSCVANEYRGSVDFNDGIWHGAAETIEFTYDQVTTLPNPEQSWYDFVWWNITWMSGWVSHYIGTLPVTGSNYSGATATWYKNLSTDEWMTDITFTAIWSPRNDTKYVVYHYIKNLGTNTYTLSWTVEYSWTTDTPVTFTEKLKTFTGFTYSGWYLNGSTTRPTSGKVTTGNIEKDGSLKIYLYYDRNKWKVTLEWDAHVDTLSGAGTYEYGADVTVQATAKTWYHFRQWTGTPAPAPTSVSGA